MHRQPLNLCLGLAIFFGLFSPAAQADVPAEVRGADDARLAAMLAVDVEQLDAILSEQLSYGHTHGGSQSKREFIESLHSQTVVYRSYDYEERTITPHGENLATMSGIARLSATAGQQSVSLRLRFLAVWKRENTNWKLVAYQSVRLSQPSTATD